MTTTNSQPQALPPLRAVYTDLDGTLLGEGGSVLRDPCGGFSLCQAQALQACFAAGVEVVPMTGRHRVQAEADARILGLASVIYELGCAFKIDGKRYELTGHWRTDADGTPAEKLIGLGVPDLLLDAFAGRLEYHDPWNDGRKYTVLMRGRVDVERAQTAIAEAGHPDVAIVDNGAIAEGMRGVLDPHAYHLVPGRASKARAVRAHTQARGFRSAECIALGDSLGDLGVAAEVGQFFAPANGPAHDRRLAAAIRKTPNATVTVGAMGSGFAEAVVQVLGQRGQLRRSGRANRP